MLFLENVLQSLVHTPPSHLLNIKTASTPVEPQTCLVQQNFSVKERMALIMLEPSVPPVAIDTGWLWSRLSLLGEIQPYAESLREICKFYTSES